MDIVPLTPASFHILLVLAGGEGHGYAIMQEIERLTGGQIRLGPGTLYRSLFRLESDGLIREIGGRDPGHEGDERRRLYRLTPDGLGAARAEARRLEALVAAARRNGLLDQRPARRRVKEAP